MDTLDTTKFYGNFNDCWNMIHNLHFSFIDKTKTQHIIWRMWKWQFMQNYAHILAQVTLMVC